MRLIEYILKNDSIKFKYLFNCLEKNLLKILIVTLTIFSITSFYTFYKFTNLLDIKIHLKNKITMEILEEKYRKAISNNNQLKIFMNDFKKDFYKSYKFNLTENFNNYNFVKSNYDKEVDIFNFKVESDLMKIISTEQEDLIKNKFEIIFFETLQKETINYSSALDINYENLTDSISLKKIEILQFNRINFILTLISNLIISLIISFLYILFKKVR